MVQSLLSLGNNTSELLGVAANNHLSAEATLDPVNKIRVVQPETLIDTDFEYGLQPTKWETIEMVNNIPTFFFRDGEQSIELSDITTTEGSSIVRVETLTPHALSAGSPIVIVGSLSLSASGVYIVLRVESSTVFYYKAKSIQAATANIYEYNTTFLFSGRLYQGIYIQKDVRDITTDAGSPLSQLTVSTFNPNGLSQGSYLVLTNSYGTKKVFFDASNVSYLAGNNISTTITTNNVVSGESGYLSVTVNPYDYQSLKSVFFTSSNVSTASDTIHIPEHGLASNTYVMYTKPVGDTQVGGLTDGRLYKVNAVDAGNLSLYSVAAAVTDSTVDNRDFTSFIDTNDSNKVLLDLREKAASTRTTSASITYSSTGQASTYPKLFEFIGFVKSTGTSFSIQGTIPDTCRIAVWIGKQAIRNTTSNYTYFVKHDGIVGSTPAPAAPSSQDADDPTSNYIQTLDGATNTGQTLTFTCEAGRYYPIRVRIYVGDKNATCSLAFPTGSVTVARYAPNQTLASSTSASVVDVTSQGTSTFGPHALHKVYPIEAISSTTDVLTCNVAAGTSDAPLLTSSPVTVASESFGVEDAIISLDNISSSRYTKYTLASASVGSITLNKPGGSSLNITNTIVNGMTWVLPMYTIPEYDSIYKASHGFAEDDQVMYMVESGVGPSGLSNNATYYVEVVGTDRFRVKTTQGGATTDISSVGNALVRLTYFESNPTQNAIIAPATDFIQGTSVVYSNEGEPTLPGLVNGNTYTISNVTSSYFKLSQGGVEVTLTGNSSNSHSVTAQNGTDGNYPIASVTSETTFTINPGFSIPFRTFTVVPAKQIVNTNGVYRMYVGDHNLPTGAAIRLYPEGSNDKGATLYSIRNDKNYIQIAQSQDDAYASSAISLSSYTGSTHTLEITSITSELIKSSNVSITENSTLIQAPDVNFLSLERIGDAVIIETGSTNGSLVVQSVDTSTDIITFTASHGLNTGDHIFYTSGTAAGLTNDNIYYVRSETSASVSLYDTYSNAITQTSKINLTDATAGNYGNFVKRTVGTIYTRSVSEIHTQTDLSVDSAFPVTSNTASYLIKTLLFPRADGSALHRPYDGGVEIIPSTNPDATIIRQTRKYFRYQSGKGVCVSKAVNFNAPNNIKSLTRSGSTATVVSERPHRLSVGVPIKIVDALQNQPGTTIWNGTYTVESIVDDTTFTFTLTTIPTQTSAGGFPMFLVESWNNSFLRAGLFDDQNGIFFEFDGTYLHCVRRTSVKQLSGICMVTFLSNKIQGTGTQFTTQIDVGDYVVIKGQSYKVISIPNNTTFYVSPPYRGQTSINVRITKTIDLRVRQSDWNIDVCDGTGSSGFLLDTTKIQMCYIDYSWYGAGKVRFGFKGADGKIFFCHEFIHNNVLTEAYMRSGNLPARYEVMSKGNPTYVPPLMHWGTSIIMDGRFDDDKAYLFTAAGSTLSYTGGDSIDFSATLTNTLEAVPGTTLTGYRVTMDTTNYNLVASVPSGTLVTSNAGTGQLPTDTYTVGTVTKTKNGGIMYVNKAPTVTGAANLTAGDPNDTIPSLIPLVSIRLAPSVDNNLSGVMGNREIINRMQLVLKSVGLLTTNSLEVYLIINGYPYNKNFEKVPSPSLSQLLRHEKGDSLQDGIRIFTFNVSGSSTTSQSTTFELDDLVTLGNSILGGDDIYPNGPDLLTIAASFISTAGVSITSPASLSARISWTESQA